MNHQPLVLALLVTLGAMSVTGLATVPVIEQIDAQPDRAIVPPPCTDDKRNGADLHNPLCGGR